MDSHEYLLEEYKKCIRNIHSLNTLETNKCFFLWNKLIQSFKEKENTNNTNNVSKPNQSKL
jgi:hypothetical protein